MAEQLEPHATPSAVSLCRESDGTPCRFVARCHETRQRLQHYADLRGMQCWAYQQFSDQAALPVPTDAGTAKRERATLKGEA